MHQITYPSCIAGFVPVRQYLGGKATCELLYTLQPGPPQSTHKIAQLPMGYTSVSENRYMLYIFAILFMAITFRGIYLFSQSLSFNASRDTQIGDVVLDCSFSISLAFEILQSCTKPSKSHTVTSTYKLPFSTLDLERYLQGNYISMMRNNLFLFNIIFRFDLFMKSSN